VTDEYNRREVYDKERKTSDHCGVGELAAYNAKDTKLKRAKQYQLTRSDLTQASRPMPHAYL